DAAALSLSGPVKWTQLTPASTPKPLEEHAAIYDPVRQRLVTFGGMNADGDQSPEDEVWGLALSGSAAWTFLGPPETFPGHRNEHSAIYDAPQNRAVVFGGIGPDGYSNDVWAASLGASPAWTRLAPTGTPPPSRGYHSAILDRPRN